MLDWEPMENNETMVDPRVYEISFIFDNRLEEARALEKADAIKQSIASLGGSFISEEPPYLRELAFEMIRVINNVNTRFNEGYFGWIKFEGTPEVVTGIEKKVRDDEEIIRYLIVKTVRENTVYTKRAPVLKAENIREIGEQNEAAELVGEDVIAVEVEEKPKVAEEEVKE